MHEKYLFQLNNVNFQKIQPWRGFSFTWGIPQIYWSIGESWHPSWQINWQKYSANSQKQQEALAHLGLMEAKAHICLVVINGSDRPDHFSIGRVQPFKGGTYTQKNKKGTSGSEMVAHLPDNNMKRKKKKWVRNGGPVDSV